MMSQFANTTSLSIFWHCYVSLVKFSYWSNFYVQLSGPTIMIGSGVMTIFFIKDSPEIWKLETICFFPNIWKLVWVRDTEFGTKVSNKMLLNAAKYQGYSFYRFWVILWCLKSKKERARIERRKQPTLH